MGAAGSAAEGRGWNSVCDGLSRWPGSAPPPLLPPPPPPLARWPCAPAAPARLPPARPPAGRCTHTSAALASSPEPSSGRLAAPPLALRGGSTCPPKGRRRLLVNQRSPRLGRVPCAWWYLRPARPAPLAQSWLCGSEGERGRGSEGNNPETFILDCAQAREEVPWCLPLRHVFAFQKPPSDPHKARVSMILASAQHEESVTVHWDF